MIYDESIDSRLAVFLPLVETIANQFSPYCESVLHDLRKLDNSLVAISGNVTNRTLGAPITDFVLRMLKQYGDNVNNSYHYLATTKDGRRLKSSTTFIRDNKGHVIGCFCINFCIEAFLVSSDVIKDICSIRDPAPEGENLEQFANDVSEVVKLILEDVLKRQTLQPLRMEKSDKMDIVEELDSRGLFLVKGAINLVASKLEISKFTLYGYLDEIKKAKRNNSEKGYLKI
ncbi:helix-turn-helix transcriptional regulator [Acetomicrobium sp. UBA5826]|uniref:helix-turn-helix transcriptional regulator n=1 Tax=Acetomicrobium sp. UBA5826 TaxID=1946039 RepID=UPI0025799CCD|nr:PAS domain-containing protein [Acetomicrobium sp. UBA5826]